MERVPKKQRKARKFHRAQFFSEKGLSTLQADIRLHRMPREKIEVIEQLGMVKNRLTSIPSRIFECTSLRLLSLCDNEIEEIPESITKLKNLAMFSMHNNNIKWISPRIEELTQLSGLVLTGNKRLPRQLEKNSRGLQDVREHVREIAEYFENVRRYHCLLWCIPQIDRSSVLWLPKDVWKHIAKFLIK